MSDVMANYEAAALWAVGQWDGFPVSAHPRPLVVLQPRLNCPGFTSIEAKRAYELHHFVADDGIPAEVVRYFVREPPSSAPSEKQLRLRTARLQRHVYRTDRGPKELPAWRVEADETLRPFWLLAEEVQDWPREGDRSAVPPQRVASPRLDSAQLASDGVSMELTFIGAPERVASYSPPIEVSTDRAVTFIIEEFLEPGPHRLPAQRRRTVCRLREPLGNRVLANFDTTAVEVVEARDDGSESST